MGEVRARWSQQKACAPKRRPPPKPENLPPATKEPVGKDWSGETVDVVTTVEQTDDAPPMREIR